MEYMHAETIVFWIVAIPPAAFLFLFFVLFPLVIFVVALTQSNAVVRLGPISRADHFRPSRALN